MPIRKHATAALVIAALAVPAISTTFLAASATPAFAKGPGGNGNKGGKSRNHAKPNKPSRSASNGNKGGNSNGKGSGKPANVRAASASSASVTESTQMAPNQLGSMNGALHANINAVLAHIRNGNTNGPVGSLAGLAVADHNAEGAQDLLDLAAQYDTLSAALEDAGYDSLLAYQDAVDAGEIEPIAAIEDATSALGDAIDEEPPTDQEIADAEAALEAQQAAEGSMLDAWNKSGSATDEEKAALLQALRDRLDAEGDAISQTIGTVEMASATGDVTGVEDPLEQ